jgi:hypothetical protein
MLNVITLNVDMLSIIMLSVIAPNMLVCNLKICMLCTDGTPCFATAVSYARNMLIKSTTGVNFIKIFCVTYDGANKLVFLSDLTHKHQKRLARPATYKHSSLFELLISNKEIF